MSAHARPAWWQTVIVASCSAGATLAFAGGMWDEQWAAWLALFLAMELGAAASREFGDTFSERLWTWLGVRPRRPSRWWRGGSAVVFLAELGAHVFQGGTAWWAGGEAIAVTAVPLCIAIASGYLRWRNERLEWRYR